LSRIGNKTSQIKLKNEYQRYEKIENKELWRATVRCIY